MDAFRQWSTANAPLHYLSGSFGHLPFTLVPTLLLLLTLAGCGARISSNPPNVPVASTAGTVTVEFFVDGQIQAVEVSDVADGATVESVLRRITEVDIEISGTGALAFVDSIAGKQTSGGQGWTYKIDGQRINQGVGSAKLHPPSTVSWRFGDWDLGVTSGSVDDGGNVD